MKKFIVTTTINPPTEAILKYDSMKDWNLIVVGDLKTPKNYKLKNGIYFSPSDQKLYNNELSNLIGFNCIERRNFGFILANELGAEIIATIDDDNIPKKNWGKNLLVSKKTKVSKIFHNDGVFDPIYISEHKHLWHRGFPLDRIDNRSIKNKKEVYIKPDVQADFWDNDPDIDCICRIMYQEKVKFKKKVYPFYSNKLSPFNTQNTFFCSKILKDYYLFPGVGRMHDIWASYYLQYVNKIKVVYNSPSVIQKRNIHTIRKDMHDEFIGIKKNNLFVTNMIKRNFKLKDFFNDKSIQSFKIYKKHIKSINEKK